MNKNQFKARWESDSDSGGITNDEPGSARSYYDKKIFGLARVTFNGQVGTKVYDYAYHKSSLNLVVGDHVVIPVGPNADVTSVDHMNDVVRVAKVVGVSDSVKSSEAIDYLKHVVCKVETTNYTKILNHKGKG